MAPSVPKTSVANSLVTLSSAAILAVYTAGFLKTRAAAQQMEDASNTRPPVMPAPATAGQVTEAAPIEPPAPVVTPGPAPSTASTPAAVPAKQSARVNAPARATSPAVAVPAAASDIAVPAVTPPAAAPPAPAATIEIPVDSPVPALKMPKEHYNDGTFLGWGTSRHGDIQASVTIEGGRIVATKIAQCLTRYSCSWVAHLPPQVVDRQSPEVDYVSGATQSANAFYWAVVDALKKAK